MSINSLEEEPFSDCEAVLQAFRSVAGLQVCVKLFQSDLAAERLVQAVLDKYSLHNSPFCLDVKQNRKAQCVICDLRHVPMLCEQRRRVFTHTCHAGACEIIIPLFFKQLLIGIIYIGQFRRNNEESPALPYMDEATVERMLAWATMLQAYFIEQVRKSDRAGNASFGDRGEAILRYLRHNLREDPRLADLAGYLGLSVHRTGHVVREETGLSFIQLRDRLRLERAQNLLSGTGFKIAQIAHECGFANGPYFHRFFYLQTGITPNTYRRQRQANGDVI
jgi:AraC-like DNA-binding protein